MSASFDDLPKGEGKVLADRHIAVSRDEGGTLRAMSSICPHRGCDVEWNRDERAWDCPCHGSRFAADGAVLRGPAMKPLPPAEVPPKA